MNSKHITSLLLVMLLTTIAHAQAIELHSITDARMGGPDPGYTLDGMRMIDARSKLENINNFYPGSGIYPKEIWINDGYDASGDLTAIGQQTADLFYFGTFNILEPTLAPFTNDELDSLYQWSLRGGKMIVGACANSPAFNLDNTILNSRWGYSIMINPNLVETDYYPTAIGAASKIYNGPFGSITFAYQGGAVQGYFDTIPANCLVLAQDLNGNPNLILDCKTLDLILSDGDGHNDLGGISGGLGISTENDIFWVNTIAYMDSIDDPPTIQQNGTQLSTGTYATYQWVLNGVDITGATSQTYNATQSGSYTVKVTLTCGCITESPIAAVVTVGIDESIQHNGDYISIYPNPVGNVLALKGVTENLTASVYNNLGQCVAAFDVDARKPAHALNIAAGAYTLKLTDKNNRLVATKKLIKK